MQTRSKTDLDGAQLGVAPETPSVDGAPISDPAPFQGIRMSRRAGGWRSGALFTCVPLRIATAVVLLAVAVALAQAGSDRNASDDAIVKAVLEINAKMTKAANSLDADTFFTYILDSDQCVIIQNGQVFKTRQEALEAVKRGFLGISKMDRQFENPRVTVISPDVALLASEGTMTATLADGQSRESRFAVSLVFVRRDGQWKLLNGHYSTPVRM